MAETITPQLSSVEQARLNLKFAKVEKVLTEEHETIELFRQDYELQAPATPEEQELIDWVRRG